MFKANALTIKRLSHFCSNLNPNIPDWHNKLYKALLVTNIAALALNKRLKRYIMSFLNVTKLLQNVFSK